MDLDNANICHLGGALLTPYWLPDSAVTALAADPGSTLHPVEARFAPHTALSSSKPAVIVDWSPNGDRLLILAPTNGWVFISRAWWPAWLTTVDGVGVSTRRALGGQLVRVSAGSHVIDQRLVAWDAGLGLALGLITVFVTGALISGALRPSRYRHFRGRGRRADSIRSSLRDS